MMKEQQMTSIRQQKGRGDKKNDEEVASHHIT